MNLSRKLIDKLAPTEPVFWSGKKSLFQNMERQQIFFVSDKTQIIGSSDHAGYVLSGETYMTTTGSTRQMLGMLGPEYEGFAVSLSDRSRPEFDVYPEWGVPL